MASRNSRPTIGPQNANASVLYDSCEFKLTLRCLVSPCVRVFVRVCVCVRVHVTLSIPQYMLHRSPKWRAWPAAMEKPPVADEAMGSTLAAQVSQRVAPPTVGDRSRESARGRATNEPERALPDAPPTLT